MTAPIIMAHNGGKGATVKVYSCPQSTICVPDGEFVVIGRWSTLEPNCLSYDGLIAPRTSGLISPDVWGSAVKMIAPTTTSTSSSDFTGSSRAYVIPIFLNKAFVVSLPNRFTRHNSSSGSVALFKALKGLCLGQCKTTTFLIRVPRRHIFAIISSIARLFPKFNMKSSVSGKPPAAVNIEISLVDNEEDGAALTDQTTVWLESVIDSIRGAARIVDSPANITTTTAFVEEAKAVAAALPNVTCNVISGEELELQGFGGIYSVGKCSLHPPSLVVLSHSPECATKTVAWVGKGIVYDTGGMQIKTKVSMPGMKKDCGGAAALLYAFNAAVRGGFSQKLHVVLCLAENMIGPKASRPDDIITMLSGKTVEINNTDAEGRLVLGDGVYYAQKMLKADVVLDMATLTGAQRHATGDYHAALLCNNDAWETATVEAGRISGDLVHPLPYCPELHFPELSSCMADMKNSLVGRPSTAVSAVAGLFIHAQVNFDHSVPWLHVDMACPVESGDRATGYGVALVLALFGKYLGEVNLMKICPELATLLV